MKITKRQLRKIIKEALDRYGRPVYPPGNPSKYRPSSGQLPPNPFLAGAKMRGGEMKQKGFSDGFNGEFPQEEDDPAYMQGYEEGQKASDSGDYSLAEARLPPAQFPPVTDPLIAQYFNEEKYHDKEGTGWAKEYKTYRYKHGGGTSGHQDLVVYYKTNGTYMARVYGAYNNRVSDDDKGEHPDALTAIEKALNTAPGGRPPFAKDLIVKVGEKSKGDTGGVPMYD